MEIPLGKVDSDMPLGMITKDTPFVAIWMITYNHERYIAEAIEGVINQKTSFKIKLFICEDNSQDNTKAICEEYAKKYPDKIDLKINKTNLGVGIGKGAHIENYKRCLESNAKYIALCEGDDYWTDLLKLQKQVDLLENQGNIAMCTHEAEHLIVLKNNNNKSLRRAFSIFYRGWQLYGIGRILLFLNFFIFDRSKFWRQKRTHDKIKRKEYNYLKDFISGKWYMPLCSIVTRRNTIEQLLYCLDKSYGGHQALLLLGAINGGIYHFKDIMAVKRDQETSITKDDNRKKENRIREYNPETSNRIKRYECIKKFANNDQEKILNKMINNYLFEMQKFRKI